jgi:tetratricopeptide (TPR) repeat protein
MRWRDEAFAEVQAAESRNPNSAPVRMAAGLMNHAVGWNDRAVDDYRGALERDPSNAEAWLQLGIAYEGMNNRTADAAAAFQKAVELQPTYYAPHLQLGLFYYRRANYAEAEKQFLRVTQLAPELAQGFSDLGGVYVDMHRVPEAIRALRRSLELGESRGAVMNLGAQLANQGQDAEALVYYERALAIGPQTYILFLNLGDSYRRVRQEAKASHAYEQGRELADRALSTDQSSGYARA